MSIWTRLFRNKNDNEIQAPKKTVLELTTDEKAAIEDDLNCGVSSSDSARALNLDVSSVYYYRKSLANKKKEQPVIDPVKQREIIKNNFEIAKMQLDMEATLQKMQLERMDFEKKLAEWKAEIYGEDSGSVDDQMSLGDLKTLLESFKKPNESDLIIDNTSSHIQTGVNPSLDGSNPPAEITSDIKLDDEQIRAMIKTFPKEQIKLAKIAPDQLIMDQISEKFPTLSEETILKGIEILKKEF